MARSVLFPKGTSCLMERDVVISESWHVGGFCLPVVNGGVYASPMRLMFLFNIRWRWTFRILNCWKHTARRRKIC